MLSRSDDKIFQSLNLYAKGKLKPDQRKEIEYRLKVEPKLAHYLSNLVAVTNLEKVQSRIPRRLRVGPRLAARVTPKRVERLLRLPPRTRNLWLLDEHENAYFKAAAVIGHNTEILRPMETHPLIGQTLFAVCETDAIVRALYLPNKQRDKHTVEISVVHYGTLPEGTVLEIRDRLRLLTEYRVTAGEAIPVVVRQGHSVLRTKGTVIPDTTLLLT